jgi:hypothetical protein
LYVAAFAKLAHSAEMRIVVYIFEKFVRGMICKFVGFARGKQVAVVMKSPEEGKV